MNASLFPCLLAFAPFLHNTRGVCQVFGGYLLVGGVINAHQALRLRWQLTFTMLLKRNQVVSGKKPTWLANYTPNYAKLFSARKFPRPQAVSSLKTIWKSGQEWRKAGGFGGENPLSLANPGGSIRLMPCRSFPLQVLDSNVSQLS